MHIHKITWICIYIYIWSYLYIYVNIHLFIHFDKDHSFYSLVSLVYRNELRPSSVECRSPGPAIQLKPNTTAALCEAPSWILSNWLESPNWIASPKGDEYKYKWIHITDLQIYMYIHKITWIYIYNYIWSYLYTYVNIHLFIDFDKDHSFYTLVSLVYRNELRRGAPKSWNINSVKAEHNGGTVGSPELNSIELA